MISLTKLHALFADGGPLLADIDAWRRMGDRFTGENLKLQREDVIGLLVIVALFAALFLLLRFLAAWQRKERKRPSPKRLFAELAAVHRLGRADQRHLRNLAQANQVRDPAELFVRPEAFRGDAAEGAVEPSALASLRDRLFNADIAAS